MIRIIGLLFIICTCQTVQAQKVIFEEHFKDSVLNEYWQAK